MGGKKKIVKAWLSFSLLNILYTMKIWLGISITWVLVSFNIIDHNRLK